MAKKLLTFTQEELRGVLEAEHARGYKAGADDELRLRRLAIDDMFKYQQELLRRLNTQAAAAKSIIALATLMEEVR